MRNTIAVQRTRSAGVGSVAAAGRVKRLMSGMLRELAAFVQEVRRIPEYTDQAEAVDRRLRRAQSSRSHPG
ncbi:MAG TPA: hypothetical protein VFW08_00495 [bacterium]|nr:hypothetical protein [bacterium]